MMNPGTWCGVVCCLFGMWCVSEGILGQRILRCRVYSFRKRQIRVTFGASAVFHGRAWVSLGFSSALIGAVCIFPTSCFIIGPITIIAILHALGMSRRANQIASE